MWTNNLNTKYCFVKEFHFRCCQLRGALISRRHKIHDNLIELDYCLSNLFLLCCNLLVERKKRSEGKRK